MLPGKTLVELATEVERQSLEKKDYIAPQGMIGMGGSKEKGVYLHGLNGNNYPLKPLAHQQVASHLGIPKLYYDRMMAEAPDLLAANVNNWLGMAPQEKRLVRTLDGQARAFLSDRYRPLDNIDYLKAILPEFEGKKVTIPSCEVTDSRMYMKVLIESSKMEYHGKYGNGFVAGMVVFSNSEVGQSSLRIEPGVYDFGCTNLHIFTARMMRKYHIGRQQLEGDDVRELLSDGTRKMADKAFWHTVKDVVRGSLSDKGFREALGEIEAAANTVIENKNLNRVVELAADHFKIGEEDRPGLLRHLIERGDYSKWGMASAFTRLAADVQDYDYSTELERIGGKVIELPQVDWKTIACAN